MAHMCRHLTGSVASCAGWVSLIVATSTNDWVTTCDYSLATCVRLDELATKGLWAECVIAPALYHCVSLNQILSLPAYLQTSRALMIVACLLGLPALLLVVMSLPCVRLPNDTTAVKRRRALVGGILILIMAVCGAVATIWFPVATNMEKALMAFGFSLYTGWVGAGLCLCGGSIILCCHGSGAALPIRENSFYYSRQSGRAAPLDPPANHAKSVHV
ncbi:claudin-11-like [Gadus chalcogrammus]|uniref:claudin-11-like n=1 Tax=Gadus chalcogrammus TaxID=1042646 RepID=UPI0024C4B5E3|nr:claudin-11-like [Gadus chalcogrammus]